MIWPDSTRTVVNMPHTNIFVLNGDSSPFLLCFQKNNKFYIFSNALCCSLISIEISQKKAKSEK